MVAPIKHEGFIDSKALTPVRQLSNFKIKNPFMKANSGYIYQFSKNFRAGGVDVDTLSSHGAQEKMVMGKKPRQKSGGWATHNARKKAEKERSGKRVVRGAAQ